MGCYLENITTGNKLFKSFQVFLRRYFPGRYFMFFFRCWWVHKTFCDALERLFTKKFMSTEASNIISELKIDTVLQNLNNPKVQEVQGRSIQIKSKGLNGDYGKTLQYRLTYIQMVSVIQLLHLSFKVNNFELRWFYTEKATIFIFASILIIFWYKDNIHVNILKQF